MKLFLTALAVLVLAAPTAFAAEGDEHAAHGDAPKKEKKVKKMKPKNACAASAKADAAGADAAAKNPCASADAPKK